MIHKQGQRSKNSGTHKSFEVSQWKDHHIWENLSFYEARQIIISIADGSQF